MTMRQNGHMCILFMQVFGLFPGADRVIDTGDRKLVLPPSITPPATQFVPPARTLALTEVPLTTSLPTALGAIQPEFPRQRVLRRSTGGNPLSPAPCTGLQVPARAAAIEEHMAMPGDTNNSAASKRGSKRNALYMLGGAK
jgi:hypothetical protein